jgi:hypothetical protein
VGPPSLTVRLAVDRSHQHSMQPGVEAVEIAESLEVAPGEDEGFLDGVVGEIAVAEHEVGDAEEAANRVSGQDRERIAIPASCLFDQVSPHRLPLLAGSMRRFS